MFTTAWKGISAFLNVGGIPGRLVGHKTSAVCVVRQKRPKFKEDNVQPVQFFVVCELEQKLVDDAIDSNGSTQQLHRRVD